MFIVNQSQNLTVIMAAAYSLKLLSLKQIYFLSLRLKKTSQN